MSRYVIIGNSAAAVGCVEGIRQQDKTGGITLISTEPHFTYSRPLISYLLWGKTDEGRMRYRPADFYQKNRCERLAGRTAVRIDTQEKSVQLDDGRRVSYDKLLVATGSRPFVPAMPGLEKVPQRFTFLSLDDARRLEAALTPEARVLIVGAGLIGLKCAEGIFDRVRSLAVVDLADRVLPSILDETGSRLVRQHLEKKGIRFYLSDSVSSFEGNTARLQSGAAVNFDLLVIAVGVRPNAELVQEAGGTVNRGITVDAYGRTSLPDVYAAGDCTETTDIASGESRVLALLPNAYMQGESAGTHMAGGTGKPYDRAIAMNAIGFFGYHVLTAGVYTGDTYAVEENGAYKKLFYHDNLLKGFILIGQVERAGIYTSLIRNRTPLDSLDFELIREKPQLMAFSRRVRARALSEQG